jgi:hypothetical protein
MTWTDATTAVNTVLFESNYAGIPQNHTMYLISGNAYGYNATLPAGTFYWKSYANDSAGNLNASSIQTFTINKASTTAQLYIDGARANKTITYGAQSNATAITDMGSVTLYRNGTAMGNPEIATLGAGYYNYTAVNAGNENYTGSSETFFLTVDKITPTLQLLLDGVADNKTVTYGTQSNATASESNSGDSDALYTLYRNDDIVSNPDVKTLGANTYTYVYNTSGGANYTSAAISRTLTVNKAPTDVRLYLNGNEGNASQTYGAQSNATATINVGGLAIQLSREGTPASNPDIGTLAAGYYNYTADFAGNENYSADSQTYFLTINKATPTLSLLINGLDSDDSIPVFTDVIINASSTIPAGAVIGLYEDDVLEGSSTSVNATRNYTTLGDRIWKINISETQNYTSAEKNHTISVVDAGTPQYSNLKEHPTDPAAYYPTKTYQFNATWTDNVEISTVILEFNGANYTLTDKAGNEYYKSFSNLAAGTYDYKWHANDTSNNWGSTPIQTYTVDKAVAALFLTMLPGNNADYGTTTTVSCSSNNLESSPALTRNANGVSNPDAGILEVGTYNYACTAAATQNYTSASATGTLIIGKASPIINLTLNDADSDITLQSSGGSVNITATLAAPDSGDLNLTQAGVLINSGASPLTNTSSFTTTGTYTILTSFAGNDNYTSVSKSHTITVPKKGGGGGSGGGGGDENSSEDNLTITQLFDVSSEFKTAGDRIEKTLGKGSGIEFTFANESHIIAVNEIYPDSVQMKISSKTSYVKINAGETEKIDMNGNGYYDAAITLNSLTAADATLEFELLQDIEKVPQKIGCAENWSCTNWTECNAEGAQIRACKDVNQCGNEENKPIEIQSCSPPSCDDKIRNQGEFGVDCGGPCAKRCNAQEIATTGKAVEVPSDEKVKIGTGLLMLLSMLVVLLFAINRVEHKIKLQKTNKGNFKKLRFEIILANIVHIIIIMAIVLLIYYLVK